MREFPAFPPVNVWFDYPIHRSDPSGALSDLSPEAETTGGYRKQNGGKAKKTPQDKLREQQESLESAFAASDIEGTGEVKIAELQRYMGVTKNTVKTYIDNHPDFERSNGIVRRCQSDADISK